MAKLTIPRPAPGEYAPFHAGYVAMVPDGDVLATLKTQHGETLRMLSRLGDKKSRYRYAPGKWSIREVIGHLIDAERVFTYRALTFARADRTPLPGFDEKLWADSSNADSRTLKSLLEELKAVRSATLALFRGFNQQQLTRTGIASGHSVSVRGLVYVTTGHERHHATILRQRYLAKKPLS
jgi:uncharacterized damage-inducible protein DinB